MKFFVVVSVLLAVAQAAVISPIALQSIATPAIVAVLPEGQHSSQYHSQDAIGQYSYGYANERSAKNEIKLADGQTVGSYAYVDPEGNIQKVQYRSDGVHGFRVSATNLPVGPSPIETPALSLPEPVRDTPEVIDARAKHLEAFRQAKEAATKAADAVSIEVKSAVQAHPAVITPANPATIELVRAAPLVAAPSFGYSFGINYNGLYSINSYSLGHQPLVATYTAPTHFFAPSILSEAALIPNNIGAPEAPKELPEVVEARAKHFDDVNSAKKDAEKEQTENNPKE